LEKGGEGAFAAKEKKQSKTTTFSVRGAAKFTPPLRTTSAFRVERCGKPQ